SPQILEELSSIQTMSLILSSIIFAIVVYLLLNLKPLLKRSSLSLPPGPKPWPILGNLPHLGPIPHHSLAALAQKYGPLMHLKLGSVHVMVVSSASVASQFLKVHDANFSSRPPSSGGKHIAYNHQDMVFAPYGPRWRMLRKICNVHLFSTKALDDFCHVRQEEISILTRTLAGAANSKVKLGQLLNICTTNALARVTIGRRVFGDGSSGVDPKADEFKEMVGELMVLAGVFNVGDFIPPLDWLDLQGVVSKMKKLHKRFDAFLNEIIDEHRMNGGDRGDHTDFLSKLLALKDNVDGEGGGLRTDTSSSTVEWAIAELISHPKVLAQVQQELDSLIGPDRLAMESDLTQLQYFQAVMKEVFRLHPSTPLSLPRMASESCEINAGEWEIIVNGIQENQPSTYSTESGRAEVQSSSATGQLKELIKNDAEASSIIDQTVSEAIFPITMNASLAKEAWERDSRRTKQHITAPSTGNEKQNKLDHHVITPYNMGGSSGDFSPMTHHLKSSNHVVDKIIYTEDEVENFLLDLFKGTSKSLQNFRKGKR
ncbi:Cytochrome P450, partial [Dillenia turbinata]